MLSRTALKPQVLEALTDPAFFWNVPGSKLRTARDGYALRFQNYKVYNCGVETFMHSLTQRQPLYARSVLHPRLFDTMDKHFRFLHEHDVRLRFSPSFVTTRLNCIRDNVVFLLGVPIDRVFLIPKAQLSVERLPRSSSCVYVVSYDGPDKSDFGYSFKLTETMTNNIFVEGFSQGAAGAELPWESPARGMKFTLMLLKGVRSLAQMERVVEQARKLIDQDYSFSFPFIKAKTLQLFMTDLNDVLRSREDGTCLSF